MTMEPSAIRTRMRDPGLVAAPSTDAPTARVTFEYLAWATVWLLVGTTIGLIASIKLHWPEFLPFAWLSFGRVRPAHTNLVLLGWSSLALVGLALYVVSRTSRVPLWSPRRREPRPPGISRVGVAAGGHPGRGGPHRRGRGGSHGGRARPARGLRVQLVHPRRVLLPPDPVRHPLPAVLPRVDWQHGRPGLLHAQSDGHVGHPARARRQLLRDPTAARPPRLLLCPRRPRVLDQSPLLPADRRASLHLQPGAVVAPEHRHSLQRGHDGAGVGGGRGTCS